MKSFILALGLVILMFSVACVDTQKNNATDTKSVLNAKIDGYSNKLVIIKNEDPYILDEDSIFTNDQGQFTVNYNLKKPAYFQIMVDGESFILYLRPHDELNFSTKIDKLTSEIRFSGNSSVYNNYLLRQYNSNQKFQNSIINVFILNSAGSVKIIDSIYEISNQKLKLLKESYSNIDDFFYKSELKRNEYFWAYNRLMFAFFSKAYAGKINIQLAPDYYSFLNVVSPEDSSLLYVKNYREYLDAWYYYHLKVEPKSEDSALSPLQLRFCNLPDYFKSQRIIDFMAFEIARTNILSSGIKDVDELDTLLNMYCSHLPFKNFINNQFAKWNHLRKGQIAKDFTFISMDGDSVKLSHFKGKYIYIDVWATWCKPCLEEVPALQKLQDKYGNKNVVFLSISVDQDRAYWLKFLKEKKMKGIQLFAGRSDMLYNYYLITGIPRFILIDDKGKFVESTASSPRMGAEKLLDNLLK